MKTIIIVSIKTRGWYYPYLYCFLLLKISLLHSASTLSFPTKSLWITSAMKCPKIVLVSQGDVMVKHGLWSHMDLCSYWLQHLLAVWPLADYLQPQSPHLWNGKDAIMPTSLCCYETSGPRTIAVYSVRKDPSVAHHLLCSQEVPVLHTSWGLASSPITLHAKISKCSRTPLFFLYETQANLSQDCWALCMCPWLSVCPQLSLFQTSQSKGWVLWSTKLCVCSHTSPMSDIISKWHQLWEMSCFGSNKKVKTPPIKCDVSWL